MFSEENVEKESSTQIGGGRRNKVGDTSRPQQIDIKCSDISTHTFNFTTHTQTQCKVDNEQHTVHSAQSQCTAQCTVVIKHTAT